MAIRFLTALLLAGLMCAPALAGPNLLENGKPEQLPSKTVVPKDHQQVDSGAYKYFLDVGSKALPGWTVTRALIIYDWSAEDKVQPYVIDLHGGGAIEQEVATVPGKQYRLSLLMNSQKSDTLKATFGDGASDSASFSVGPHQPPVTFTHLFTATQPRTMLTLASTQTPGYGPYLTDISLVAWDPAGDAVRSSLDHQYRRSTDGFSAGDIDRFGSILADDFSFIPKTGETQNRPAYLQAVQDAKAHKGVLTISVESVTVTETGADVVADLALYVDDAANPGQRTLIQSRVKDVWLKQGDNWTLQSRTEQGVAKSAVRAR